MAIILRLDRMMADRKISLNDLSEQVGIANVNLSKIKTGKVSAIRFSTLNAICKALNCQPGDILEYLDDENPWVGLPTQGFSYAKAPMGSHGASTVTLSSATTCLRASDK